jgi:hypothetical protein
MKLRIKGNSLRLRLGRSEVARLAQGERLEERVQFTPDDDTTLIYGLEQASGIDKMQLRYKPMDVTVLVSDLLVARWAANEQVGLYDSLNLGSGRTLDLLVEKDFACLDVSDEENVDTFPNPIAGTVC